MVRSRARAVLSESGTEADVDAGLLDILVRTFRDLREGRTEEGWNVERPAAVMSTGEAVTVAAAITRQAGMAEAYYTAIAPHNPLGPISLAAGVQMAASIPNFFCQEQVGLGEGYITKPLYSSGLFRVRYSNTFPSRPGGFSLCIAVVVYAFRAK